MRKFYIRRLQTIHGKVVTVYIKRIVCKTGEPKFFSADGLKIASIFTIEGLKEFQLLGSLPNIEYTVVEIDRQGQVIQELSLNSI